MSCDGPLPGPGKDKLRNLPSHGFDEKAIAAVVIRQVVPGDESEREEEFNPQVNADFLETNCSQCLVQDKERCSVW